MNAPEIKAVRKDLGMTQVQFADAMGVAFATVSRWEKGHCEPTPNLDRRIKELRSRMDNLGRVWTVYLLRCGDDTLYCGITNGLRKRLKAHRDGKGAKYTRGRLPLTLEASRTGLTKRQAMRLERRVKKVPRARKKEVLLTWTCCPHCGKEIL